MAETLQIERADIALGATIDAATLPLTSGAEGAAAPDEPLLPTVERSSYEIGAVIAEGGIGRVTAARDVRLARDVALKELRDDRGEGAARFVREASITARLQHPAIIPIYEAGRWPTGELFYAMKLVRGRSFAEVIDGARSLEERLSLLHHVIVASDAVAYAHSKGIVHRDLKPANILVGPFGETVVIDWGLAKDLRRPKGSRALGLTRDGTVVGTPAFMPPEQARGERIDERADVYSLGAILYHLLSGAIPYEGDNPMEVLVAVAAVPPPPLRERVRGVPDDLAAIVEKAMARAPADRYRTAGDLVVDLKRFEAGQIVAAYRYTSGQLVARFVRRYRAILSVSALALLAIAVSTALFTRRLLLEKARAEQSEKAALTLAEEAQRRTDELTVAQARSALAQDPNRTVAWLKTLSPGSAQIRAARFLAADARNRGLSRVLLGHTATVNRIRFSPDGRLLATAGDDHTARLWDTEGHMVRVLQGHTDEVWDAIFSPDGKLIATRGKDRTIRLFALDGRELKVLSGHAERLLRLAFSPDGARLVSLGQGEGVRLWDVATGEGRIVHPTGPTDLDVAFSPDGSRLLFAADGLATVLDLRQGRAVRLPGQAYRSGDPPESEGAASDAVRSVAFAPDGRGAAALGYSGKLRLWSDPAGPPRVLAAHAAETRHLAYLPDGRAIVSTAMDGTVTVTDILTGRMQTRRAHDGAIQELRVSPDGRRFVTSGADRTVRVFETGSDEVRVLRGFEDAALSVAISADGARVAAASTDRTGRVWDLRTADNRVLARHSAPVVRAAATPDGRHVLSAGDDGEVRLSPVDGGGGRALLTNAGKPVAVALSSEAGLAVVLFQEAPAVLLALPGGEPVAALADLGPATRAAFSPDGKALALGTAKGVVHLWDVASRSGRIVLEGVAEPQWLAFSPDGRRLGVAGADGAVRVWTEGGGVTSFTGHQGAVPRLAFSPDGLRLASSGVDHTLRMWDLATGSASAVPLGGDGITDMAFSGDGRLLVVAPNDTLVWLRDGRTGQELRALRGHAGLARCVAISDAGDRVVTGGLDSTVRLWHSEAPVSRVLRGHSGPVVDVAFMPGGEAVLSAGQDGTVRLWLDDVPAEEGALRAWLAAAAGELDGSL